MKNQESNATGRLNLVYAISRYTYLIMLAISVPFYYVWIQYCFVAWF